MTREHVTTILAPAKVNLSLALPARYPDGFHLICSLMVPIDICDEVELALSQRPECQLAVTLARRLERLTELWHREDPEEVKSFEGLRTSENTVTRVVSLLFQESGVSSLGVTISVLKQIPWRAGLGGGSSDAAAALIALNRLLGLELSQEKLYKIGAKIGSDVAAAVARTLVFVTGRGERVQVVSVPEELRIWLSQLGLVVVRPEIGISTPWAYARYREMWPNLPVVDLGSPEESQFIAQNLSSLGLATGESGGLSLAWGTEDPWDQFKGVVRNDFEGCVGGKVLTAVREALQDSGARIHLLSGSGSACVGVFESVAAAKSAALKLSEENEKWYIESARFRI